MTVNEAMDDPLVLVSAIRRTQERVLRDGTGTALDGHVLRIINGHLQTFVEEAPQGAGEAAQRCLQSLYRHHPQHCAENTLLHSSLPKPWHVTGSLYLAGVEPLRRMAVAQVDALPGQHQMTSRCSNADAHSSLLRDHERKLASEHPDWTFNQVQVAARDSASKEWANSLRDGRTSPCARHSTTQAQFREAAELACRIVETQSQNLLEQTLTSHPESAVRNLVFEFFQNPIWVTGQGHFGDGQNRVCGAREHQVAELPVLVQPY